MKQLAAPRPNSFQAYGQTYGPLPYKLTEAPLIHTGSIDQAQLESLVSYLGSGLYVARAAKSPCFRLFQVADNAERLLQCMQLFGGGIYGSPGGIGRCRGSVYWYIAGPQMKRAAKVLASVPSPKQKEFEMVANWSPGNEQVAALKALQTSSKPSVPVDSIQSLAGCFDKRGCIFIGGNGLPKCTFSFALGDRILAESILNFCASLGIGVPPLQELKKSLVLQFSGRDNIFPLLHAVRPYIHRKARMCDIILAAEIDLPRSLGRRSKTLYHIRDSVSELSTNTGWCMRWDDQGIALVRQMLAIHRSVWRKKQRKTYTEDQRLADLELMEKVRQQKSILRINHQVNGRRKIIQGLLSNGATVRAP